MNKKLYLLMLLSAAVLLAVSGCMNNGERTRAGNSGGAARTAGAVAVRDTDTEPDQFGYLSEFEGLHITGTPIDIDIGKYRLTVSGAVEHPLSLTFGEIKEMEPKTMYMDLVCYGFFVDSGDWTGTPLRTLLGKAGVKPDAQRVEFTSYDGSYTQSLSLERTMEEDVLVAYAFNGKEFHKVHGFPLRIAAKGEPGAVWVKWLGSITVF